MSGTLLAEVPKDMAAEGWLLVVKKSESKSRKDAPAQDRYPSWRVWPTFSPQMIDKVTRARQKERAGCVRVETGVQAKSGR